MTQQQSSIKTAKIKVESLEQAFQSFNEVSSSLSQFYEGLESKVSLLSQELANERSQKVQEYQERARVSNRLENLLRVLPGGVIVIDSDGLVQEYNPAAKELLSSIAIGERWKDVVNRAFQANWGDGHGVILNDGRYVNISTQALDSEPGQILLITDVTENQQLQEQISGLKRVSAMGEMAAALAHQIRTPLSSALLYVSNLGAHQLDEDRRKRFSKKIMTSLQHLEILVEEMLLFAKGGRLNVKPHNINKVLKEIIEQQNNELHHCNLNITYINQSCETVQVNLAIDAFKSALQNLFNNACQAGEVKVTILVTVEVDENEKLLLKITDDGPGIPETIKSSLFEPFVTTRDKGTGLGLAVVDAVIRAHKGTILVNNLADKGTCFTIQLPVLKENSKFNKKQ